MPPKRQCALKRASMEKKYNDTKEESHTLLSIFFKLFFAQRKYFGRIFDRITLESPFHRNGDRLCQRYGKIHNATRRQQLKSPHRQICLRTAEYRREGEREKERKRESMDSSKYFGHIKKAENKKADTAKNKSAVKKKPALKGADPVTLQNIFEGKNTKTNPASWSGKYISARRDCL